MMTFLSWWGWSQRGLFLEEWPPRVAKTTLVCLCIDSVPLQLFWRDGTTITPNTFSDLFF